MGSPRLIFAPAQLPPTDGSRLRMLLTIGNLANMSNDALIKYIIAEKMVRYRTSQGKRFKYLLQSSKIKMIKNCEIIIDMHAIDIIHIACHNFIMTESMTVYIKHDCYSLLDQFMFFLITGRAALFVGGQTGTNVSINDICTHMESIEQVGAGKIHRFLQPMFANAMPNVNYNNLMETYPQVFEYFAQAGKLPGLMIPAIADPIQQFYLVCMYRFIFTPNFNRRELIGLQFGDILVTKDSHLLLLTELLELDFVAKIYESCEIIFACDQGLDITLVRAFLIAFSKQTLVMRYTFDRDIHAMRVMWSKTIKTVHCNGYIKRKLFEARTEDCVLEHIRANPQLELNIDSEDIKAAEFEEVWPILDAHVADYLKFTQEQYELHATKDIKNIILKKNSTRMQITARERAKLEQFDESIKKYNFVGANARTCLLLIGNFQ